jgi:hypothetical protein
MPAKIVTPTGPNELAFCSAELAEIQVAGGATARISVKAAVSPAMAFEIFTRDIDEWCRQYSNW